MHSAMGLVTEGEEPGEAEREPLHADLIIVDEFTMADMVLAFELFSRIVEGTRVLLLGDVEQLPSVGPGNVLDVYKRQDIFFKGFVRTDLHQVVRRPADAAVQPNLIFIAKAFQHSGGIIIVKSFQLKLRRPPTEQRAFISKHLVFHKANLAAAQDQEQAAVLQQMVDSILEARFEAVSYKHLTVRSRRKKKQ